MRHALRPRLLVACATLLAFASLAIADDDHEKIATKVEAIAAKPHSPKLTVDALKVYPPAGKYRAQLTIHANGETHQPEPVEMHMKWVDGQYVVFTIHLQEVDRPVQMVVSYDKKVGVYRKWILAPDGWIFTAIGTRAGDTRTISWVGKMPSGEGEGEVLFLGQEHYTDNKSVWSDLYIKNGKVTRRDNGVAKMVKE